MVYRGPRCPAQTKGENGVSKECRKKADGIVGYCTLCEKIFCSAHRLMEEHKCEKLDEVSRQHPVTDPFQTIPWWMVGLDEVLQDEGIVSFPSFQNVMANMAVSSPLQYKQEAHEANAAQLEKERTQVVRI